jgi:hypothetical protein
LMEPINIERIKQSFPIVSPILYTLIYYYTCILYIYTYITSGCEAGAGEIYSLARHVRFDVILTV